MSEQPAPSRGTINRDLMRARFRRLTTSRQYAVLGPAEILGLGGSFLVLVLVIISYLYFLTPARSRLEALQSERSRLQSQLRSSADIVRQGQSTEATVQTITQSLDAFENIQLSAANSGRRGLYDALNQLIRKNGLRNTSGPTYTPLEPIGSKAGSTGSRSVNTKWQSIYPGIAISVTVEGQYQNLRRFIRDIETNRQFVIINSVELERSTEANSSLSGETGVAPGAKGSLVSLRLEMTTYFQRGSADVANVDSTGH
jgi:Tfp pilus assembly protein PilO